MKPDPVIDSVRAARHAISERCGHDPKKLVEYYLQRQEALRDRLAAPKRERGGDEKAKHVMHQTWRLTSAPEG